MSLSHVLRQILDQAKKSRGLDVVFDLDSTLFCVSTRTQAILRHLSEDEDLKRLFPEPTSRLKNVRTDKMDWGLRAVLSREQIMATIDFFDQLRMKWSDLFFSSEFLLHDEPYVGAVEYVKALDAAGANVYYLTGRDRVRMGEGTLASLRQHGFPLLSESALHMKPDAKRHDADFKKDKLLELNFNPSTCWFFENEPVIINLVRRHLPDLPIVYMKSVHSGREEVGGGFPCIGMEYKW